MTILFGAPWFAEWAVVAAGLGDIERARDLAAVALTKATQRAAAGHGMGAVGGGRGAAHRGRAGRRILRPGAHEMRRHGFPLRRVEVLTGLALAVDEPEIAAAAAAAAVAVRDEQHMVLPAGIAARLDEIWEAVGIDRRHRPMGAAGERLVGTTT